jgi:hypothetical protein
METAPRYARLVADWLALDLLVPPSRSTWAARARAIAAIERAIASHGRYEVTDLASPRRPH